MFAILALLLLLAILLGIWYWESAQQGTMVPVVAPVSLTDRARKEVAAALVSAPVNVSAAEVHAVSVEMVTSRSNVTDAQRKAVAAELER